MGRQHPEAQRRNATREDDYAPPGGESRAQVRERSQAALLEIARRHPGERLLVVTHSAFLATLMRGVLGQQQQPNERIRALAIPNTAINVLRWSGDGWQLVLWGDVGAFATCGSSPSEVLHLLLAAASAGAAMALLCGA